MHRRRAGRAASLSRELVWINAAMPSSHYCSPVHYSRHTHTPTHTVLADETATSNVRTSSTIQCQTDIKPTTLTNVPEISFQETNNPGSSGGCCLPLPVVATCALRESRPSAVRLGEYFRSHSNNGMLPHLQHHLDFFLFFFINRTLQCLVAPVPGATVGYLISHCLFTQKENFLPTTESLGGDQKLRTVIFLKKQL